MAMQNSIPTPHNPAYLSQGYGGSSHLDVDGVGGNDFATTPANPIDSSPLSHSLQPSASQRRGRFEESFDAETRGTSILMDDVRPERSSSRASTLNQGGAPSRSGTLKKRSSVKRSGSLKRSGSRKSTHAGSIRGVSIEDDNRHSSKQNSVFYTPVPTTGSPTEILANRFQAWRKLLKDLISYFREVSTSYEQRAKTLLKVSNVINNTNAPTMFLTEGGLNDANRILRDFHKQSVTESHKAKEIQNEVINQLGGLRADLAQKIKEIKSLSGDFKNNVEKEKETTRKCVSTLEEALAVVDSDPDAIAGKGDPYVVRLGVDRQVERQIDEENYLHRAYLNLENSGRELESIVVGEIQKAYNALATILKRDADELYSTVDQLRNGPIAMPRDLEWNKFVNNDPHFVNPSLPLRRLEEIEYPGKHHPAATEVRAGMLERKSKYLKSYTPGWYVLSPTHLHEFKSADRIYTQPPVMSLYLPDQKLGSHSQPGSSSHKFVVKGRQTGSMHRGHTWVFRAESYDTMLAWYEDIKNLTEKSGEERNAFVRRHARSVSRSSARSVSSDGGLEEDEADRVPYSANQSMIREPVRADPPTRPSPGGRFPSDIQMDRNLQAPLSPNSSGSSEVGHDLSSASGGLAAGYAYPTESTVHENINPQQQNQVPYASQNAYGDGYNNPDTTYQNYNQQPTAPEQTPYYSNPTPINYQSAPNTYPPASTNYQPQPDSYQPVSTTYEAPVTSQTPVQAESIHQLDRHTSNYGDWMAPAAGGAAAGVFGTEAYRRHQVKREQEKELQQPMKEMSDATPTEHPSAIPVPIAASTPAPISILASLPVELEPNSLVTSPAASHQSFLGVVEPVPATASTVVANGGPASNEIGKIFPGVQRQDTDISVSDLHVPGEYPRVTGVHNIDG
ncbi:hypothetical protein K504DRAFT_411658 [Pleomassaria siparia CBS 279.74]|uniref:PH domain-containing protein n=1 Tax=Pleomassaria siparia CBS 279.74 TaxID=1314801 RepID=A0A6G1K490_9PLEO|nr:hypothetical protein K504DRAFT_411658 [Pleomassaria siparia CBS 279.74]